jgi:O-acetyl-ADP-ribose deacetylase
VETWKQAEFIQSFLDGRVLILAGDITKQRVDAIVNAANSTLRGGGGVDGAIHEAGGPEILAACEELRRTRYPQGLPTGEAVITTGGRLPARYVIHTVGPIKGSMEPVMPSFWPPATVIHSRSRPNTACDR